MQNWLNKPSAQALCLGFFFADMVEAMQKSAQGFALSADAV